MDAEHGELKGDRRPRGYEALDGSDSDQIKTEIDRTRAGMAEKVNALQDKLRPRNIMDQVMESVLGRSQNGDTNSVGQRAAELAQQAGSGLLSAAKNHPVPAALIGVGLLWAVMDQARNNQRDRAQVGGYSDDEWLAPGATYTPGRAGRTRSGVRPHVGSGGMLSKTRSGISSAMHGATDAASSAAGSIAETVGSGARSVRRSLGSLASGASDTLSGMVHSATDAASSAGHAVTDTVGQFGRTASVHASRLSSQTRTTARSAARGIANSYEEYPLAMGSAALVLGLLAGVALPTTRAENELLGPASDELTNQLKQKGRSALRAGKKSVRQVVQSARQAAQNSGDVGESIKTATAAAVDEAQRQVSKLQGEPSQRGGSGGQNV